MHTTMSPVIEPLIRRKIFRNEREAIHELVRDYMLRQISELQEKSDYFRQKYGMEFQQFAEYLHERSALLQGENLSPEQRQRLGQAVMQEEDDWFDWKMACEMLENWLGIRQEVLS